MELKARLLNLIHFVLGLPALRRVGSMHHGRSTPWDFMHLSFENNAPNLYKLWSGKYKSLDVGLEEYEIPEDVWVQIWQETAEAVHHLPADFVRALGNGPTYFTAEAWCFWIVYLAPVLLEGRFSDPKYHSHLCQYSDIVKRCIGFVITYDQIDELQDRIIDWVRKYEEYYYQYDEERLSACPLTIHGLLHVADDIRFCGPSWTTWTFWVERYCGFLQAGIRSKRFPWANMNNRILRHAYLEQLGARYDLEDELSTVSSRKKGELSRFEYIYPDSPYKRQHLPDASTLKRIAGYFAAVLRKKVKNDKAQLPTVFQSWGKVRIVDGDSIRCMSAYGDGTNPARNNSFIRYELQVPDPEHDDGWRAEIFYGSLEEILVCDLPQDGFWGTMSGTKRLLAVITPCKTSGKDAAKEITSYTQTLKPIVTDIRTIVAVVGRVQTRKRWVIRDRTGGLINPKFLVDDEDEADDTHEATES
ncbi:hypothetical protein DFH07DRAFT_911583 [Mycena maculata]|uniref:Uncharacterized protein n=1 Tax=Mycena maculata TaxID=230809 RepID=A0AAD7K3V8_9AGAR|nr:hypothetical protein DFH07DRAFT_911583 [Mycena maculata]